MQYVLTAKELTNLAKEIATACEASAPAAEGWMDVEFTDEPRHVLERHFILWDEE